MPARTQRDSQIDILSDPSAQTEDLLQAAMARSFANGAEVVKGVDWSATRSRGMTGIDETRVKEARSVFARPKQSASSAEQMMQIRDEVEGSERKAADKLRLARESIDLLAKLDEAASPRPRATTTKRSPRMKALPAPRMTKKALAAQERAATARAAREKEDSKIAMSARRRGVTGLVQGASKAEVSAAALEGRNTPTPKRSSPTARSSSASSTGSRSAITRRSVSSTYSSEDSSSEDSDDFSVEYDSDDSHVLLTAAVRVKEQGSEQYNAQAAEEDAARKLSFDGDVDTASHNFAAGANVVCVKHTPYHRELSTSMTVERGSGVEAGTELRVLQRKRFAGNITRIRVAHDGGDRWLDVVDNGGKFRFRTVYTEGEEKWISLQIEKSQAEPVWTGTRYVVPDALEEDKVLRRTLLELNHSVSWVEGSIQNCSPDMVGHRITVPPHGPGTVTEYKETLLGGSVVSVTFDESGQNKRIVLSKSRQAKGGGSLVKTCFSILDPKTYEKIVLRVDKEIREERSVEVGVQAKLAASKEVVSQKYVLDELALANQPAPARLRSVLPRTPQLPATADELQHAKDTLSELFETTEFEDEHIAPLVAFVNRVETDLKTHVVPDTIAAREVRAVHFSRWPPNIGKRKLQRRSSNLPASLEELFEARDELIELCMEDPDNQVVDNLRKEVLFAIQQVDPSYETRPESRQEKLTVKELEGEIEKVNAKLADFPGNDVFTQLLRDLRSELQNLTM